ncbi:unnamed protein product [Brassica napus]|uniref:(rape) hypothetical protein n=1 Tax=Brassica napus TaxID=3708 RepID=A0A816UD79_BRANA|nr:unnamed protein product [Brassica napus]
MSYPFELKFSTVGIWFPKISMCYAGLSVLPCIFLCYQ